MAGRGPAPKPAHARRRRNSDPAAPLVLPAGQKADGPSLASLTGREEWTAETVAWFEDWRTAPQALVFMATDWRRLALLAHVVERHFRQPSPALLAEIRLNEERLGATVVDRQRARMVVEHAPAPAPPSGQVISLRIADRLDALDAEDAEDDDVAPPF
jgi:hypothetical protein